MELLIHIYDSLSGNLIAVINLFAFVTNDGMRYFGDRSQSHNIVDIVCVDKNVCTI